VALYKSSHYFSTIYSIKESPSECKGLVAGYSDSACVRFHYRRSSRRVNDDRFMWVAFSVAPASSTVRSVNGSKSACRRYERREYV